MVYHNLNFKKWENESTEKVNNLPKVIEGKLVVQLKYFLLLTYFPVWSSVGYLQPCSKADVKIGDVEILGAWEGL